MKIKSLNVILGVLIAFLTLGCNISIDAPAESPNLELTAAVQALAIQQTQAAQVILPSPVVIVVTATPEVAAAPANTNTAEPAPTAQQPEIANSTLCWIGPGPKYEVVSSLSKGQVVEVLGVGSIKGWYVINNPLYNDPCWVQDFDIKLDPSLNLASLQVIYPPPPPTKTPVPPTPTP